MQEKYGFVYIWYDRKRSMYYIGSHWGTETDGYICSSNRMRDAYRRRPEDFKRRILSRVHSDRLQLLDEEQRWFDMVKDRSRYYNLNFTTINDYWWTDRNKRLTVGDKISKALTGKVISDETKAKISVANKGKVVSDDHKLKISNAKIGTTYKPMSEQGRENMSIARTGRKVSDETRAKLSESKRGNQYNKGNILSEDSKAKISAAMIGKPSHRKGKTLSPEHIAKIKASKMKVKV